MAALKTLLENLDVTVVRGTTAVSYTHLDVYKRQALYGVLFDSFTSNVYVLLIATAVLIAAIGLLAKKPFYSLDSK